MEKKPQKRDSSSSGINNCRRTCSKVEAVLKGLLPLILLVVYSFLGAFMFHIIEEPKELEIREQKLQDRGEIRNAAARRLDSIYNEKLTTLEEKHDRSLQVLQWVQQRLGIVADEGGTKWNYWGSMFYAMTLYTTIGYGYQAPTTTNGRVATCIYVLFGIPLALISLVHLGRFLAFVCRKTWSCCIGMCNCCHRRQWNRIPNGGPYKKERNREKDLMRFPLSGLIFLAVAWLLVSAGLFLIWEDWDYGTALYFAFISFTTVGLGDVVPKRYNYHLLFSAIFVIIGLTIISALLEILQQKFEALVIGLKKSIDEHYQAAQGQSSFDGRVPYMTTDPQLLYIQIECMVYQLSPGGRLLYALLSPRRKRELAEYWMKKANMKSAATQTEEAPTIQNIRLQSITEEQKRSHDDINSLVMMCDFALASPSRYY